MRPYKKFLIVLGLYFFTLNIVHANTQNTFTSLYQMLKILTSNSSFSMEFTQQIMNNTSGQATHAHGQVNIEKPNKFRWDYQSTPTNIISCDGETLKMILPEDEQVMLDPIANQHHIWSPISILMNPDKLDSEFELDQSKRTSDNFLQYRLTPKNKNNRYEYLLLKFKSSQAPFEFSITIIDLAANENILTFSKLQPTVNEVIFSPAIPANYQVTDFSGRPIKMTNK